MNTESFTIKQWMNSAASNALHDLDVDGIVDWQSRSAAALDSVVDIFIAAKSMRDAEWPNRTIAVAFSHHYGPETRFHTLMTRGSARQAIHDADEEAMPPSLYLFPAGREPWNESTPTFKVSQMKSWTIDRPQIDETCAWIVTELKDGDLRYSSTVWLVAPGSTER